MRRRPPAIGLPQAGFSTWEHILRHMRRATDDNARFLISLGVVAVGAALFAIAFRASLAWLYRSLYHGDNVVDGITKLPLQWRLLVPIAGAAVAGTIARFRGVPSQNVSNVMEAVALGNVTLSLRATASRVASSWAAISGGMSIGREGPLIEFGGSLGAAVGRATGTALTQTRVLVAAGTAAGFAAAYNTPFAATLFVLETIAGVAALELVLPVMAGTVAATLMTRAVVGAGPIYGQRTFGYESNVDLLSAVALGVVAAMAALSFKRTLAVLEHFVDAHPVPQPFRAMAGGLLVGSIAVWFPAVVGNGYDPLNRLLDNPMPVRAVAILLLAKLVATSGSVASGVPGGIFTPMLLMGAALGSGWSHLFGPTDLDAGRYALMGMAAATAASIHAPLTATVMIFELSGDYPIALPLMVAAVVSTAVSKACGSESVYETELRKRGLGWDITLEGRQLKSGPHA
jgi:CIC family chloride channel protein